MYCSPGTKLGKVAISGTPWAGRVLLTVDVAFDGAEEGVRVTLYSSTEAGAGSKDTLRVWLPSLDALTKVGGGGNTVVYIGC